uniref:Retrovirus-related Pol polyprotein from transposon TNT 1-94 n=1 Tax=Tanacetum cinerariifolium TaxID=118510 RepID=A0A6L2L674_TANCI|nr:retrovirus-related Pol polyprotein from transposon TNT 1-94 [Tanacetum cinerariifolium]
MDIPSFMIPWVIGWCVPDTPSHGADPSIHFIIRGSSGLRCFFRYAMFIYSFYLCYSLSLYPFTERYAQPYFFSCLIRQMVNTRTDADLSATVQNALQTLLPQIRAEIREEFRTSSGPSDAKRRYMLGVEHHYMVFHLVNGVRASRVEMICEMDFVRYILACSDDDDDYSAITPNEPVDSLSMGDEHLDTILATESNEFIKSCVENLVPNPSESEGENGCDVLACFTTFSNILFDAEYKFDSVDDQSCSDEDVPEKIFSNPLFEEEINSVRIDQHHFNDESDIIESLLNRDSSIFSSFSKIDSLLDEFAGELTLLKSIPPGIDETDCYHEDEIRFSKRLLYDNLSPRPPEEFLYENSYADIESFFPSPIPNEDSDSFMEEIDLPFTSDDPMPPSIENDDYDSKRDILIREELLDNYSLSLPVIESFYFDIPSFSRPPAKPPDGDTGILNIKIMGDISDQKVPMPKLMITPVSNKEKSPDLLSHRGLGNFQLFVECPMMIHGKNIPIPDYSRKCEESFQRILSSKSSFPQLQLGNQVKENKENDKIGEKPGKNGKHGKARQCRRPITVEKEEKEKKYKFKGQNMQIQEKDYKAEYKKMKAKLALIEASPSSSQNPKTLQPKNKGLVSKTFDWDEEKVSDEEEVTQVKVLMALADDELTVRKNHARNGKWVDITMRKVNTLLSMDEDADWQNYLKDELLILKQAKLDAVTFEIQNIELIKLNHALQEQLKEEKKINEKWLTSSKKVSQCISEQIPHQKKKVLGGELLTESLSKININENAFILASMGYDQEMVPKTKDWVEILNPDKKLPNFNTGRILVPESQVIDESLETLNTPESSKDSEAEILSLLPPLKNLRELHQAQRPGDCKNYHECEIYRSYDHSTLGNNRIIQIRGGVLAESSQFNESSIGVKCNTCESIVHSTTDHDEFDHFKIDEKIQVAKAREPTKKWPKNSVKKAQGVLSEATRGSNQALIFPIKGYDHIGEKILDLGKNSQAPEVIMSFIRMVENQNDVKVKQIRTDNGTEFRKHKLESFCDEKEISQNFSSPYTSEQNGVAKRKNKTLIEAARTMLNGSVLSKHFWTEAVKVACYTQNKSIIVKRHDKTPYEIFRERILDISYFNVFRCPVFIHNNKDHLGKFDAKAADRYFLGYSFVSKLSESLTQEDNK